MVLPTDSSPWSAVRGSPELRAYSSMPRGSVPWPQRNTGVKTAGRQASPLWSSAAVTTAAANDGPATAVLMATGDDQAAVLQQPNATVQLVDTCGRVVDLRPVVVVDTTSSAATASPVPLSDQQYDDGGSCGGAGTEDDRQKHTTAALTACLSRAQEDLKHIPPGKSRDDVS